MITPCLPFIFGSPERHLLVVNACSQEVLQPGPLAGIGLGALICKQAALQVRSALLMPAQTQSLVQAADILQDAMLGVNAIVIRLLACTRYYQLESAAKAAGGWADDVPS